MGDLCNKFMRKRKGYIFINTVLQYCTIEGWLCITLCIVDCILHCRMHCNSSTAILLGGEFWAARSRTGAVTELCGCPHPPSLHHHHHRHHRHHHHQPRHCHCHHHQQHHPNHNEKSLHGSMVNLSSLLNCTKICKNNCFATLIHSDLDLHLGFAQSIYT